EQHSPHRGRGPSIGTDRRDRATGTERVLERGQHGTPGPPDPLRLRQRPAKPQWRLYIRVVPLDNFM
ncbi:MAG: hypothetical protein, partial [Olavius algarvensis Gamma 1 endosymbiont]